MPLSAHNYAIAKTVIIASTLNLSSWRHQQSLQSGDSYKTMVLMRPRNLQGEDCRSEGRGKSPTSNVSIPSQAQIQKCFHCLTTYYYDPFPCNALPWLSEI